MSAADERTGDSRPLAGQVILVTGSAERVGRVLARALSAAGATIVVNHFGQEAQARSVVGEITARGGSAILLEADISDPKACCRLVDDIVARMHRLDVVIHNASSFVQRDFLEVTREDFDRSIGVNLRGPFFLSQAAARVMIEQGSGKLIAIIGNSLHEAWPDFVPHATTKAALTRLVELLAVALSPTIQCLAVAPAELLPTGDEAKDEGARLVSGVPLVQGTPDDLAELVTYLAGSTAYLNGAVITLDGGKSLV